MENIKSVRSLVIILIQACMCIVVNAQELIKNFSGEFEDGKASYSYYEDENYERIYQGNFTYSENIEKYDGLKFTINGSFSNNLRDGTWTFLVKNYKSPVIRVVTAGDVFEAQMVLIAFSQMGASIEDINNYKKSLKNTIIFKTFSSSLKGEYSAGKLEGEWSFVTQFSGYNKLPVKSIVNFRDNKLVSSFSFSNDAKNYVIGQFNDEGYLDGEWIIRWTENKIEYENIRKYSNGILKNMVERNLSTGDILFSNNEEDVFGMYSELEGYGIKLMLEAINFWVDTKEDGSLSIPIEDRNNMYTLRRGYSKPLFPFADKK